MRKILKTLSPGTSINFGGYIWTILEHQEDGGTLAITSDIVQQKAFDGNNSNDWRNSSIREWLNGEFLQRICENEIRERGDSPDEPAPFKVIKSDLTADNGMKDYGIVDDIVSLISCELYRKYRAVMPHINGWWLTLTPWTCESICSYGICNVNNLGALDHSHACHEKFGIRPIIRLNSDLTVNA